MTEQTEVTQPSDDELLREAREDTARDDVAFHMQAALICAAQSPDGHLFDAVEQLNSAILAALATTTQPDNELADAADSEPSGEATQ